MPNDRTKKDKRDRGPRLEFTTKKIITPEFRGQFVHRLFTPSDKDQYSMCAIFEDDADRKEMKREIVRVAKEAFGKWKPGMKSPFRKGAEKMLDEDDGTGFPGFSETNFFCNLSTYRQPGIRDLQRRPVDEETFEDGGIKSGDYFKASVYAKPFSYEGKKGVSFTLCSVLWIREGEALFEGGSASDPLEDFRNEFSDEPDEFDGDPNDGTDNSDVDDLID